MQWLDEKVQYLVMLTVGSLGIMVRKNPISSFDGSRVKVENSFIAKNIQFCDIAIIILRVI